MNTVPPDRLDEWESVNVETWQRDWRLPRLLVLATTTSTNDVLRQLAETGAPAGTVVIAEAQTAGRGQAGRQWSAPAGKALLLSVLLRTAAEYTVPADPSTTPIRVGLAICHAIALVANVDVRIKWPNDIVHKGRKLAGILCEGASGANGAFVVAGIGVNVLQDQADWPPDLRTSATSLALLSGRDIARPALVAGLLDRLRPFRLTGRGLDDAEMNDFLAFDALAGHTVTVDRRIAGTACGINPDGALLVQTPAGIHTVRSGTVRVLAPSNLTPETT
jgi:BirA family biotin operon repressor/biotin-[acetyl-CoA-carboxylase] ligase